MRVSGCLVTTQSTCPYFSQRTAGHGLSARTLGPPEFALSLQLSEFGLFRKNLLTALLHCGLHDGRCGRVGCKGCVVDVEASQSNCCNDTRKIDGYAEPPISLSQKRSLGNRKRTG